MAFSEQGALKRTRDPAHSMLAREMCCVSPIIHSVEVAVRGHRGSGVMCGFSAIVPTWEGSEGFSSACWCPKQQGKRQDEDEQSKAVQLGGASKVEGYSPRRVLSSSSPPWHVCSRQQGHKRQFETAIGVSV